MSSLLSFKVLTIVATRNIIASVSIVKGKLSHAQWTAIYVSGAKAWPWTSSVVLGSDLIAFVIAFARRSI
jgi:hypothetical protein